MDKETVEMFQQFAKKMIEQALRILSEVILQPAFANLSNLPVQKSNHDVPSDPRQAFEYPGICPYPAVS